MGGSIGGLTQLNMILVRTYIQSHKENNYKRKSVFVLSNILISKKLKRDVCPNNSSFNLDKIHFFNNFRI